MKIRIQEAYEETNPEEIKKLNYYRYDTIFEGQVDFVHFCCSDGQIANPSWMRLDREGTVELHYTAPSNIRCEVETDATGRTLWMRPRVTTAQLKQLALDKDKSNKEKSEHLEAVSQQNS